MRTWLPVLMLIAAALPVAGCGSSKTTSSNSSSVGAGTGAGSGVGETSPVSATGAPLSSSQLVAKADVICKQLSVELDAPNNSSHTPQDIVHIAAQRAALEQRALTELGRLTPPASMAHDYRHILAARRAVIRDLKKLGEVVSANNAQAKRSVFASSVTTTRKLAAAAERAGFKYCGQLG